MRDMPVCVSYNTLDWFTLKQKTFYQTMMMFKITNYLIELSSVEKFWQAQYRMNTYLHFYFRRL